MRDFFCGIELVSERRLIQVNNMGYVLFSYINCFRMGILLTKYWLGLVINYVVILPFGKIS